MTRHKVGRKSKDSSGNPEYRLHKRTGQAVVTLPLGNGKRKDIYLGRFGTEESKKEYNRIVSEWAANGRQAPVAPVGEPANDLTIDELVFRFIDHANTVYRDTTGAPTKEYENFRLSLHPLRLLFGPLPVSKFGPVALEQVRDFMIKTGSGRGGTDKNGKKWNRRVGRGLCRGVVNQRMGRIVRLFKWAASKELIPHTVYQRLTTVEGLRQGRSPARESRPVPPVSDTTVDATIPHLTRHVAAMVKTQRLTGARPGEICAMRPIDIDQSGPIWVYRPGSDEGPHGRHKTSYKGNLRFIPIGPRAQAILKPFLDLKTSIPSAYVFSPRDAVRELRAAKRAARTTKVQPSQIDRSKPTAKRLPGERYSVNAYDAAFRKACEKHGIPRWHPHQLRHSAATEIRKRHGIEAAQVVLGHAALSATEVYAESNLDEAMAIAAQMG